jgi:hypothetical protein
VEKERASKSLFESRQPARQSRNGSLRQWNLTTLGRNDQKNRMTQWTDYDDEKSAKHRNASTNKNFISRNISVNAWQFTWSTGIDRFVFERLRGIVIFSIRKGFSV